MNKLQLAAILSFLPEDTSEIVIKTTSLGQGHFGAEMSFSSARPLTGLAEPVNQGPTYKDRPGRAGKFRWKIVIGPEEAAEVDIQGIKAALDALE
jgi:hypothetical protein